MSSRFTRFSRSIWCAWICVTMLLLVSSVGIAQAAPRQAASVANVNVTVHYFRFDGNYANWNLWMWPVAADGSSYGGAEHDFNASPDSFGVVANASIAPSATQTAPTAKVGIIVRLGNWQAKDVSQDRFITITNGQAEVWLVSGDPTIYTSESDAVSAKQPHVTNAYLESDKTIVTKLSNPVTLPYCVCDVTLTDKTAGQDIPITALDTAQTYQAAVVGDFQHLLGAPGDWNPADTHTEMKESNPNLYQFTAHLPAGTYHYKVAFNGNWNGAIPNNNVTLTVPNGGTTVTFSYVPFDPSTKQSQVYDSINNPNVSLPTSSAGVSTDLLQITLATVPDVTHTLQLGLQGYRSKGVTPRNVLNEARYTYTQDDLGNTFTPSATAFRLWAPTASDVQLLLYNSETGPLTKQVAMSRGENGTWHTTVAMPLANWYYLYQVTVHGTTQTAVDPYVQAIAPNATRGMIIDLSETNPPGWEGDRYKQLANPVDAVIYETHVRDFSIDPNSGMTNKGKYLAFTDRGTKGPDNVSTGVDSLMQLGITHVHILPVAEFASIDENNPNQYNWGYDPRNYNVPEGAYATTPHGTTRITEYKRMIQSLHRAHLGSIMDVVYNHTFATQISDFDKIVPQYYYRTDYSGNYTNGSGVGNEIAAERPMVRKFISDSVKYWTREYHIDGFRFDLMALLGVDTVRKISQDLHEINPNVLIYGEPWTGGTSALPADQLLTKGQQKGLGVGVFNDHIRNGLIGSVFDHHAQGFATGATNQVNAVKNGVNGSINDFTAAPSETINYVTSHDNLTLWDKIASSTPNNSEADRIKMDELAQAVVMTSQGVPFMLSGEEFLRTKGGNDNSYNAGDAVNQLDWSRKAQYLDVFKYYADIIHLRSNHPAFRMTSAEDINEHLSFLDSPTNTVSFELQGHANGDEWKNIVVIYNPNKTDMTFNLPQGKWMLASEPGMVNEKGLKQVEGTVTVPGIACAIMFQQQ